MTYLEKNEIFFERDEKGELLPVEIELEGLPDKPKIQATPLPKGELTKVFAGLKNGDTNQEADIDIIINHCKQPKFSEEDRESFKCAGRADYTNAISLGILALSMGVSQKNLINEGKKKIFDEELKKFQK